MDFLIGDLGQFQPGDHHKGAVVWLRGKRDGNYSPGTLTGWPRVADVEATDFDGDGKPDLAVAAFGWRRTGDFTILKNTTTDYDSPAFSPIQVDPRPGAIHAIPVDLNRDGLMDVVVLFSQEHETVVAFINQGGMRFQAQTLYAAPHPNWGSSGIEVVDLDDDGRLDVLLTHGDSFDDQIVKPYHGIQWLENRGTFPFVEHTLAELPGVQRAQARGSRRRRRPRHRRVRAVSTGRPDPVRVAVGRLAGADRAGHIRAPRSRGRQSESRDAGRRRPRRRW